MTHQEMKMYLDKSEVAAILKVKIYTIDRWVSQKKIPFIKLQNKLVRFDLQDVLNWADQMKVRPEVQ